LCWLAEAVDRLIGWSRLPMPLAAPRLGGTAYCTSRTQRVQHAPWPLDMPSYKDPNIENRFGARMMNGT
jgi:hypothetical protein